MQRRTTAISSFFSRVLFAVALGSVGAGALAQPAPPPSGTVATVPSAPGARPYPTDTLARAWTPRPVPDAPWHRDDRKQFAELSMGPYDVLVAPVTTTAFGLSRTVRSLAQARIAALLAERGLKVVNPYVAQRALGEGARVIEVGDVRTYGTKVAAARAVLVDLSHDGAGTLKLSAKVMGLSGVTTPQALFEKTLPLAGAAHPSVALDGALKELADRVAKPAPPAAAKPAPGPVFAESPKQAIALPASDLGRTALALQFLATLAPLDHPRARERLAEQALIAAERLPAADATRRFLLARAWNQVGSRVVALEQIAGLETAEAAALRQLLEGNLPELVQAVTRVTVREARLLLELDVKALQAAYRHADVKARPAALDTLATARSDWTDLYERRWQDFDLWQAGGTPLAKRLLERDLPLDGASMRDEMQGRAVLGQDVDNALFVRAALAHVRRARKENAAVRACLAVAVPCVAQAYLDLVEAIALADATRDVRKQAVLRGTYPAAVATARKYKPDLDGFGPLLLAEARAQARLPRDGREDSQGLLATVAWYEQGQSPLAWDALVAMGVPSPDAMPFLEGYGDDQPARGEFVRTDFTRKTQRRVVDLRPLIDEPLDYNLEMIAFAANASPELHAAARAALTHRFHGHPERLERLAALAGQKGDVQALLAEALKERPDRWDNYDRLAAYQIERGDYAAALKTLRQFPGFRARETYGAVAISNHAFKAGDRFFARGHLAEAKEFFQICADTRTGSAATMSCERSLAAMRGDHPAAASAAFREVSRYQTRLTKGDYLAWLFAMGYTKEGWAAFAQLQRDEKAMPVWVAADTGLRVDARPWAAAKDWLLAEPQRSAQFDEIPYAVRVAIMQNAVDRLPQRDFAEVVRSIVGPAQMVAPPAPPPLPTQVPSAANGPPRAGPADPALAGARGPSGWIYGSAFRRQERKPLTEPTPKYSAYAYFADAYTELRKGNFKAAIDAFDRMSSFYALESGWEDEYTFALPYFAWASAKASDPLGLERFLRDGLVANEPPRFDRALALAFFAGLRKDHDAALRLLQNAFDRRPATGARPIATAYQWAEACEWLHQATGERRYLDRALAWAKAHQRIEPHAAWAYALEAKYAQNDAERVRALGFALHLDPQSERIATQDAALKARARAWFKANNPFSEPASRPTRES